MQDQKKDQASTPASTELAVVADNLTEQQLLTRLVDYLQKIDKKGTRVIALVGGPASGKGTLAGHLAQALENTACLSTDDYVKGDRAWRRANVEDVGKDPILKYDFEFLKEQVKAIQKLSEVEELGVPGYDGQTGVAIGSDPFLRPDPNTYSKKIGHVNYLIIEGDFQPLDLTVVDRVIYMDTPDDIRLANRIHRDLQQRGESERQKIVDNFNSRQTTQFLPHTLPWRAKADLVIGVLAKPLSQPTPERKFEYTFSLQGKE